MVEGPIGTVNDENSPQVTVGKALDFVWGGRLFHSCSFRNHICCVVRCRPSVRAVRETLRADSPRRVDNGGNRDVLSKLRH